MPSQSRTSPRRHQQHQYVSGPPPGYNYGYTGAAPLSASASGPGRRGRKRTRNSDFVDFLHKVLDVLFLPITYPLGKLRDLLTSPLTISVILKAALLIVLIVASAVVSIAAVGAFWWSWGTGGNVEIEGWLVYGSREHRTPHALLQLPADRFQEDLPYDIQVELELVRPSPGAEEMGNFMVTLELRSIRAPEVAIMRAAQPSLPPPPLPSSVFMLPTFPMWIMPPCIIPWPLRALCPGRLLGYSGNPSAKIKERRRRGNLVSPARGNEVVLLTKELLEAIVVSPGRGDAVGSVFVSIGREDTHPHDGAKFYREVRTTGWVVVRFIPHPTGLRWLLTSNPIPPLLILPPISLTLTLASAIIGFAIMTYFGSSSKKAKPSKMTGTIDLGSPSKKDKGSDSDREIKRELDYDLDRGLFDREAQDDVLRAWAAVERRRRSPDDSSPSRSANAPSPGGTSDTGDTPRRAGVRPTPTETESGTTVLTGTGSITETEETSDKSESWESSND